MKKIFLMPVVYWPTLTALIMAFCWFMQSPYDPLN